MSIKESENKLYMHEMIKKQINYFRDKNFIEDYKLEQLKKRWNEDSF